MCEIQLKKDLASYRVAIVDRRARVISPFFATLLHALTLPRDRVPVLPPTPPISDQSDLSRDDVQVLEQIVAEWDTHGPGAQNFREIIGLALRRLQWELDSGGKDEVIEDLQREIEYRQWCARTG
jgi:hypothetical protein